MIAVFCLEIYSFVFSSDVLVIRYSFFSSSIKSSYLKLLRVLEHLVAFNQNGRIMVYICIEIFHLQSIALFINSFIPHNSEIVGISPSLQVQTYLSLEDELDLSKAIQTR